MWIYMFADEINDNISAETINDILSNIQYLVEASGASVTVPSLPDGYATRFDRIMPFFNDVENVINAIQNTFTQSNPHYVHPVTWERITESRKDKIKRWINWCNFAKEIVESDHPVDYLIDFNGEIINDVNRLPILCWV